MKTLRQILQEKILITAHYMDNTKTRFHTHAKDENEVNTKVSQLHHFVKKEKKSLKWVAHMPDGTIKSGRLHPIEG